MPEDQDTNAKPILDTPAGDGVSDAQETQGAVIDDVIQKVNEAHNILIALSLDPTVDEMCAAIGLSLCLDRAGKRATAIYSGATPNALEFLKPEEAFDTSADILQDFVIALSKEKADHLRYKLDGDFVKIYITPYKTRIDAEDLEFSYGDYNIDLVLALDVATGTDLDSALREHGRIMHDATIVNVTTGNPGKFGDLQWSDKRASSVSEMAANLMFNSGIALENIEATAFLTGIVAATNRFQKANTTANTMDTASRLMMAGADQQVITKNITGDINNMALGSLDRVQRPVDATMLEIDHEEPEEEEPVVEEPVAEEPAVELPKVEEPVVVEKPSEPEVKPEKIIQPSVEFNKDMNDASKYGEMLKEALVETDNVPEMDFAPMPGNVELPPPPTPPIDMAMPPQTEQPAPIAPAAPEDEAKPENLGPQPAMQDQIYSPQASDPGAFKIPGQS